MSQKSIKARVLVDCAHGKCGDVVTVDAEVLKADNAPEGLNQLDASQAAVAYAEQVLAAAAKAAAAAAEQG